MTWYDIAAAVLAQVKTCIDDCDYAIYVSQGRPTADCSAVTMWPASSDDILRKLGRCDTYRSEGFRVTMTRCCATVDSVAGAFEPTREDAEAECFLRDVDLVDRCLVCNVPEILSTMGRIDCDDNPVRGVVFDQERQGECYTAEWVITYQRAVSCEC